MEASDVLVVLGIIVGGVSAAVVVFDSIRIGAYRFELAGYSKWWVAGRSIIGFFLFFVPAILFMLIWFSRVKPRVMRETPEEAKALKSAVDRAGGRDVLTRLEEIEGFRSAGHHTCVLAVSHNPALFAERLQKVGVVVTAVQEARSPGSPTSGTITVDVLHSQRFAIPERIPF